MRAHLHQIGAEPRFDTAAIGQAGHPCCGIGDHADGLRQRDGAAGGGQPGGFHHRGRDVIARQHIHRTRAHQIGGGDVAGMAAAADDVRRARDHRDAEALRFLRRFHHHREFADHDAVGRVPRDLLGAVVVMAGQRQVAVADTVQKPAALRLAQAPALLQQFRNAPFHSVRRHMHLLDAHLPVTVEVAVLADARGVVHQAHHADQGMVGDRINQPRHVGRGQFAAQMQEMLAFQQPRRRQRIKVRDTVQEGLGPPGIEAEIAQAERIQHRRDARRDGLRVMRQHGGTGRPARIGARLHLTFQIVGVDIHDAGDQVLPAQILRGCQVAAARLDLDDPLAADHDGAMDDLIPQDEVGVGQDGVGRHAASGRGETSNRRSATRSRTSISWKMPMIAAPRALASVISAITTSRLAASRLAVGSSSSITA